VIALLCCLALLVLSALCFAFGMNFGASLICERIALALPKLTARDSRRPEAEREARRVLMQDSVVVLHAVSNAIAESWWPLVRAHWKLEKPDA